MNSPRTIEAVVSRSKIKEVIHSSLGQFLVATGFLRKDEDLIDFDFDGFVKGEDNLKLKYTLNKEEGIKISNESSSINS